MPLPTKKKAAKTSLYGRPAGGREKAVKITGNIILRPRRTQLSISEGRKIAKTTFSYKFDLERW